MNVLSLFDGMSCGQIAFDKLGIKFDGFCRFLTRRELELAQTVPIGYTNCVSYNQAQDLLGDGWTVDVIAHILKGSLEDNNNQYNAEKVILGKEEVEQLSFVI